MVSAIKPLESFATFEWFFFEKNLVVPNIVFIFVPSLIKTTYYDHELLLLDIGFSLLDLRYFVLCMDKNVTF